MENKIDNQITNNLPPTQYGSSKGPNVLSKLLPLTGFIPPIGLAVAVYLWSIKKRKMAALLTVFISGAFIVLFVWLYSTHKTSTTSSYRHTYSVLQTTNTGGLVSGQSMVFSRPTELQPVKNNTDFTKISPDIVKFNAYEQRLKSGGSEKTVGFIYSLSKVLQVNPALKPQRLQSLNDILNNTSSNEQYNQLALPVEAYAIYILKPYAINFSRAQPFKSQQVQSGAWRFDFTASSADSNQPPLHGQLIYLIGKQSQYYFVVGATKDNWNYDLSIWRQITYSIKIDQAN